MVVPFARRRFDARPLQALLFTQQRQQPKDDRTAGVELHPHEPVGDGVGDVLKVHGAALDQRADGHDGVERLPAPIVCCCRLFRGQIVQVCRARAEQVRRARQQSRRARRRRLRLRGRVHALDRKRELVAARD